jgi:hypothetical protein
MNVQVSFSVGIIIASAFTLLEVAFGMQRMIAVKGDAPLNILAK